MASQRETEARDPAWQALKQQLLALSAMLQAAPQTPVDLMAFAAGYAELAKRYVAAVAAEGRTSMRAAAAAKALDLRTGKSALQAFLQGGTPGVGAATEL